MKKTMIAAGAIVTALTSPIAHAELSAAQIERAKEAFDVNTCFSCHDANSRIVGPSLAEIGKRYKGKKIEVVLAQRIRNGSTGRWGDIPHPVYEALDEKTARLIAAWMIAGSPR